MIQADRTIALRPNVYTREGVPVTSSEDVARTFEKKHKNILAAIEALHCSPQFRKLNFQPTEIRRQIGSLVRATPVVEMTRDGFVFLAMGLTGSKAGAFKEAYIQRFNEMELALRTPPAPPAISLDDPTYLRTILLGYTERVIALEAKMETAKATIAEAKPKTEFYDSYAEADGCFLLSTAAKILGEPQKRFIDLCKVDMLFYRSGILMPKAQYVREGLFVVKTAMVEGVARAQTYVTPKGLQHFSKMLGRAPDLFGRLVAA